MLKNLNKLALEAKEKRSKYNNSEFRLSEEFKNEYVKLNPDTKIIFKDYTAIVTSNKGLDTIIPNQWFIIASFFVDFYDEILKYKDDVINNLGFDEAKIKEFKKNNSVDNVSLSIIQGKYTPQEVDFIVKFLSDYDWWFGSKTIDRGDLHYSPILSLANVVNLNQSYIAAITSILSKNRNLIDLLSIIYEDELIGTVDIEDKFFRRVAYSTFLNLLDNFGEEKALDGYELKQSSADGKIFNAIILPQYFGSENFIGQFESEDDFKAIDSKKTKRFNPNSLNILGNDFSYFTSQWNAIDNGRPLTLSNFNKYLSAVTAGKYIIVLEDNKYKLKIEGVIEIEEPIIFNNSNTIYYGAPGTGKSYKVDQIIKDLDKQFYERVTFHPEYDNASFIGGYKPISEKDEEGKNVIKYDFVPQAFANIYKRAWQDLENQYYLVIEEINRGNCAEIFGELFQLLDRNSGYTIAPSNELYKHLVEEFGDENHKGIIKGLQLPPNLAILATMNTSDQSLFPMDSAFKRRWEWEYVPICYDKVNEEDEENKSFNFIIDLGNGSQYSWIDFIKIVNKTHIGPKQNLGMDKCMGNYFVKPENENSISLKQFINKVVFYLWNDVFKDEDNDVFEVNGSYEDFFPISTNGLNKVTELFERIGLEKLVQNLEDETSIDLAAEPQEPYGE